MKGRGITPKPQGQFISLARLKISISEVIVLFLLFSMQMCLNKAFLLLARQAETNPGFCSMKQLVVFVLPPG